MALPILAHWAGRSIFDIEPAALARRGIRLLLADLDNTLAPYGEPEPTQAVRDWAAALGEQGITLFVLSNNRHPERPRRFSQALGVPFLGHAGKPKPGGFRRAMEQMGCTPEQTAIVGDQIFTDILGGRNAGVFTLLVEPIRLAGNPGRYLRYGAEWPFRMWSEKEDKTVMSAIFGPAGNAESFPYKSSVDAPRWLAELGLDCYEYQCGKGVNVREETARNIGAAAVAAGIRPVPPRPLLHQPGQPRPREPAKDHRLHHRSLSGGGLDGGGPGGHPLRRADEAHAAGGPGHRPALPESGDSRLRRRRLSDTSPCAPRPWARSTSWGIWTRCWSCAPWTSGWYPAWTSATCTPAPWGSWRGLRPARPCWTASRRCWGRSGPPRFHSHFSKIQFTPNGGEKMPPDLRPGRTSGPTPPL